MRQMTAHAPTNTPRAEGHALAELLHPARHGIPRHGGGNRGTHQAQGEVRLAEHPQYLSRRCAIHLADADFLAPVFRLKDNQPEHAYQRDDNGEQAEERNHLLLVRLTLV